jgi:hypothetical protein
LTRLTRKTQASLTKRKMLHAIASARPKLVIVASFTCRVVAKQFHALLQSRES